MKLRTIKGRIKNHSASVLKIDNNDMAHSETFSYIVFNVDGEDMTVENVGVSAS